MSKEYDAETQRKINNLLSTMALREGSVGDGSERTVLLKDLLRMGFTQDMVESGDQLNLTPIAADNAAPKPPTNLVVVNSVFANMLTWTNPDDEDLSHIEVWCAVGSQYRDQATRVAIVTKPNHAWEHGAISVTASHTYWLRAVDYAGNHSVWCPSDAQGGYVVGAALDQTISEIMGALTGPPGVNLPFVAGTINGANVVGLNGNLVIDGTILARAISAGTITADRLASDFIVTNVLRSGNFSAGATGWQLTNTGGEINTGLAISGTVIRNGTVYANQLAAGAVTAAKLAAGSVETDKLAAGAITADKIAAGTITASQILLNGIDISRISSGVISSLSAGTTWLSMSGSGTHIYLMFATAFGVGNVTFGANFAAARTFPCIGSVLQGDSTQVFPKLGFSTCFLGAGLSSSYATITNDMNVIIGDMVILGFIVKG